MDYLSNYLGKDIVLQISGGWRHEGILVDYGSDIAVLYNGKHFLYIPLTHLQNLKLSLHAKPELLQTSPVDPFNPTTGMISFRKILENAKELLVEVYVTGNHPVNGYISKILSNYFVFNSPIYKTMLISIEHLKWLALLNRNQTYYSLNKQDFQTNPSITDFAPSIEEQLDKLQGNIVILDMGDNPNKIGLLQKVEYNFAKLLTANEETIYLNLQHIKTIHLP